MYLGTYLHLASNSKDGEVLPCHLSNSIKGRDVQGGLTNETNSGRECAGKTTEVQLPIMYE